MSIRIALRLRPFSHEPGTSCPIPHTSWEAKIFPTKIFFRDLASAKEEMLSLPIKGPVKDFTIVLNLEKECLEVFGFAHEGYFHYFIIAKGNKLVLQFKKGKEILLPFAIIHRQPINKERLSLGIHKQQDWDLVCRRRLMTEVFPFWLRLSQVIPEGSLPKKHWGNFGLLFKEVDKNEIVLHFSLVFQTTFQGILSPRVNDQKYLGILPEEKIPEDVPSIGLIHEGAQRIRRIFFREEGDDLFILPELPPEFHAGRFVFLQTEFGDRIDIEWAKKQIKKIAIYPKKTRTIKLHLQRNIHSFRWRKNPHEKGVKYKNGDMLEIHENQPLFLDRFEH